MSDLIFKFNKEPRMQMKYKGSKKSSIYIPMSDGVKIAAELIFPKDIPDGKRLPTIFVQTRYWRAHQFRLLFRWILGDQTPMNQRMIDLGTSFGFAVVYIDVRGTGASFGFWKNANTSKEYSDCKEIMDWIVKQPWSDGNIISWGISYLGLTAEYAGMHDHPALKGVMPIHDYWDVLADVGAPGGIPNTRFLRLWSLLGKSLDKSSIKDLAKGSPLIIFVVNHVKPVDEDKDGMMLRQAIKDHEKNVYPFDLVSVIQYRDDPIDKDGTSLASMCVYNYMRQFEKSGVPLYFWGSWLDAGTADVGITRFLNINNRQRVVIGDWNHGAMVRTNQYFPSEKAVIPSQVDQFIEWANFFDRCLKNEIPDEKAIYYYTLVEEKWKKTTTWPPAGHEMQCWYLSKSNSLTTNPPEDATGADAYAVNFKATTGKWNRWSSGLGYRIQYPDRVKEDKKLLAYTSPPLPKDIEITGNAVITLYISSTHPDGILIAYLEDVNENGRVTYVTEGELRLIHRKLANEALPYKSLMQFHSFLRKDSMPMVKGEIAEITIGILSTSVVIRAGHKIRVAIACADKDSFARIPEEGNPVITIARDKNHPSVIKLPVIVAK
nr:CocE/NonD family hydrolase [Candidatus Sigynarchaeota archaeon]